MVLASATSTFFVYIAAYVMLLGLNIIFLNTQVANFKAQTEEKIKALQDNVAALRERNERLSAQLDQLHMQAKITSFKQNQLKF